MVDALSGRPRRDLDGARHRPLGRQGHRRPRRLPRRGDPARDLELRLAIPGGAARSRLRRPRDLGCLGRIPSPREGLAEAPSAHRLRAWPRDAREGAARAPRPPPASALALHRQAASRRGRAELHRLDLGHARAGLSADDRLARLALLRVRLAARPRRPHPQKRLGARDHGFSRTCVPGTSICNASRSRFCPGCSFCRSGSCRPCAVSSAPPGVGSPASRSSG